MIKLKVVAAKQGMSDEEFFRVALKLHDLKLGSFDDCVQALKNNKFDEADAVKELQLKK